jgi:uncharacterized protein (TIGR02001 family)
MRNTFAAAIALASAAFAPAAFAQDEAPASDITVTGSVAITSEYRLRGISQTDSDPAIQGAITVAHSSGVYIGTWASNLAGYGTYGGSNMELDLIAGFSKAVGGVTLDAGGIYYVYPGTKGTDYFEVYGAVSAPVGPVKAKLGVNWTPDQDNAAGHNIWVYTDLALPIEGTPITLKAHAGYSDGDSFYTKGENIFDYAVGVDLTYKALTLNVSYVGTDLDSTTANAFWTAGTKSGRAITKGAIVGTLTAAF